MAIVVSVVVCSNEHIAAAILGSMVGRRLFPLVVALLVALAPVARDACAASCHDAGHATVVTDSQPHHHHSDTQTAASVDAGATHSHHHGAVPQPIPVPVGAAFVTAALHVCDHSSDPPALASASQHAVAPPALLPSALPLLPIVASVRASRDVLRARAPDHIPLTAQLRL